MIIRQIPNWNGEEWEEVIAILALEDSRGSPLIVSKKVNTPKITSGS